jgi:hypothetical protein
VTPQDLLAEQFGHGTTDDRATMPLPAWTEADQARHRAELLAALGAVAPSPQTRQQLIDDLPPDSRERVLVVRAAS